MNMDKYFMWIHYERLHNHNKAKHNKTVCIFSWDILYKTIEQFQPMSYGFVVELEQQTSTAIGNLVDEILCIIYH